MRALIEVAARSLLVVAGCIAPFAGAQSTGGALIYSCTDANGKRLTSDRPIVECNAREQRVLNGDGSVKRLQAPPMTADERAESEVREANIASDRARQQEAIRRDRNLLARFPNEPAHRKAREQALDDVRKALRLSEQRLAVLSTERKPLKDESEFYVGKQLPLKLKLAIDANDASVDAQNSLAQNQRLEIVRIDKLYDGELERLKKLWSGAQPGSLGMIAGAASTPSARR